MNKKILSWLESLMEEEALGLAPNPYQEAMKAKAAEQATAQAVQETVQSTAPIVPGKIIFTDNLYTRDAVSKDLDNFYLFGDNTDDRLNTHYIPTQTQAVIRGLSNAIGIDTKHNRGWDITSFLSDADFDSMQEHYNNQFKLIEDKLKEGHNVIIPRAGIGTGKAQLPNKAPRIFEDINNRISNLYNIYNKGKAPTDLGTQQMTSTEQKFYEVSSAGDKRFSALYATFKPGTNIFGQDVSNRTIESVYQHGVKQGDWITNNNYKTGRPMSKAIITGNTEDDSYAQGYLPLWQEWAKQNPDLIEDLRTKSKGMQLNDKFARTRVSQARALTDILNTVPSNEQLLRALFSKFKK